MVAAPAVKTVSSLDLTGKSYQCRKHTKVATMMQANGIVPADGGKRKAESRPSPTDARAPKKARTEAVAATAQPAGPAAPAGAVPAHQAGSAAAAVAAQGGGVVQRRGWVLPPPEPPPTLSVRLGTEQRLLDSDDANGDGVPEGVARCFEAAARKDAAGRPVAVLSCSAGGRRLWTDELGGQPAAIAGTLHFAAVALMDGTLQVHELKSHQMSSPSCPVCDASELLSNLTHHTCARLLCT